MDSHTTGPEFKTQCNSTLSNELLTNYHHNSIIKLSICWCVWKVGEGFPDQVWLLVLLVENKHFGYYFIEVKFLHAYVHAKIQDHLENVFHVFLSF